MTSRLPQVPRSPRSPRTGMRLGSKRTGPLVDQPVARLFTAPRVKTEGLTESPRGYIDLISRQELTARHVQAQEEEQKARPHIRTVKETLDTLREELMRAQLRAGELERELLYFRQRAEAKARNQVPERTPASDLGSLTPERYTRLHELFQRTQKRLDEKTEEYEILSTEYDKLTAEFKQFRTSHSVKSTLAKMSNAVTTQKANNLRATNTVMKQHKSRLSREMTKLHRTTHQLEQHNDRLQQEVNSLTGQLEAALVERDAALSSRGLTSKGQLSRPSSRGVTSASPLSRPTSTSAVNIMSQSTPIPLSVVSGTRSMPAHELERSLVSQPSAVRSVETQTDVVSTSIDTATDFSPHALHRVTSPVPNPTVLTPEQKRKKAVKKQREEEQEAELDALMGMAYADSSNNNNNGTDDGTGDGTDDGEGTSSTVVPPPVPALPADADTTTATTTATTTTTTATGAGDGDREESGDKTGEDSGNTDAIALKKDNEQQGSVKGSEEEKGKTADEETPRAESNPQDHDTNAPPNADPLNTVTKADGPDATMLTAAEAQTMAQRAAQEAKDEVSLAIKELDAQLVAVKAQFTAGVQDLADTNARLHELQHGHDQLQHKYDALIEESKERGEELEAVKESNTALEDQVLNLESELDTERHEHEDTRVKLAMLQKDLDTMPVKLRVTAE